MLAQSNIVCTCINLNRQNTARITASARHIQGELADLGLCRICESSHHLRWYADRNADTVASQISKTKNTSTICNNNNVHLGARPVRCDFIEMTTIISAVKQRLPRRKKPSQKLHYYEGKRRNSQTWDATPREASSNTAQHGVCK